jgi:hypothetical protein
VQFTFFLKKALATLSKLGHRLRGGLVSEVAFGAVSDSLGADRLGGTHTKPITYCRDRREKPLDAGQGHDSAEESARLERCVGLELTEETNRLTRGKATIRPKKAHAWSDASVSS